MKTLTYNHHIFIFWLFVLTSLISVAAIAEQNLPKFQLDIDYHSVLKTETAELEQLADLESISNIEYFYWFGCDSCYQVEAALIQYSEANPDISIRRTPLIIRSSWREQAYIQAMLEQLDSLQPPILLQIYQQCLTDCSVFQQFESSQVWLLDKLESEELPTIDPVKVWQNEKTYQKRADLFSINQVPTMIINEKYQVDAKQAQTPARMIEIVNFLLQKTDKSQQ